QAEDGIRDPLVTGVQTCALPISPFAASQAAEDAAKKAMEHGVRAVDVYVKGPGSGREAAIRSLQAAGLGISAIIDVTPIPHNGRSEERRVGKAGKSRGEWYQERK